MKPNSKNFIFDLPRNLILLLVLIFIGQVPAYGQEEEPSFLERLETSLQGVIDKTRSSVVGVTMGAKVPVVPGVPGAERRAIRVLSGVVIGDGEVVSLGRGFMEAQAIDIHLPDGSRRAASVKGVDATTNIALISVDTKGLTPAQYGNSKRLRSGSIVIAIGNPYGLEGSASFGNVSGRNRVVRHGAADMTNVLQITNPVNPGDPGGFLSDSKGRLVGMLSSSYSNAPSIEMTEDLIKEFERSMQRFGRMFELFRGRNGRDESKPGPGSGEHPAIGRIKEFLHGFEMPREMRRHQGNLFGGPGISFAIPSSTIQKAVARIRKGGTLARGGYIGVSVRPIGPPYAAMLGLEEGLLVIDVVEGGPAAEAGIQALDVILEVNGRSDLDTMVLKQLVESTEPGEPLRIEIVRQRQPVTIDVRVGTRGTPKEEATKPKRKKRQLR